MDSALTTRFTTPHLTVSQIVWRYTLFALLATGLNFYTQEFVTQYWFLPRLLFIHFNGQDLNLPLVYGGSLLAGTLAGLLLKYHLDKKYIFYFFPKDSKENSKIFLLYSSMSVITTIVFWSAESFAFLLLPNVSYAKYLGGAFGLSVGYCCKYYLDRRFVFNEQVTR